MRWIKQFLLCLTVTLLLSGCATAPSEGLAVRTITVRSPVCPPLAVYPATVQSRVADSLDHMPRDDPLGVMIVDYGQLRAALRAACASKRTS